MATLRRGLGLAVTSTSSALASAWPAAHNRVLARFREAGLSLF